jgi:transcriptional regulator with XRE-family HTH domain
MKSDKGAAAQSFGTRLRALMAEKGWTSQGSRSGVDVPKLAEVAQTTYEMARRYAEGSAMPRPDRLAAIASWLGVNEGALVYGDKAPGSAIDARMLESCLQAVTMAQTRTGRTLSAEKAAHLVAILYQEAHSGRIPSQESADLMVRAMA